MTRGEGRPSHRTFSTISLWTLVFILALIHNMPATVIVVNTEPELQAAVSSLASGDTVRIGKGNYWLTACLVLDGGLADIALIGVDRDSVALIGPGMANSSYGSVPHLIMVRNARDVYIANMTLRDVYYHPVIVQAEAGAFSPHFDNLHIIDAGEQFIKVTSAPDLTSYCDSGVVENCTFEYTDRARHWYTNGVDILATADWLIRDNSFLRIRGPVGVLAGPAVLAWQNAIGTIVERNVFIECDFGISMGNSGGPGEYARDGETVYDNQNSIVRNNFIYRAEEGDVGITLNRALNAKVYNNTVILNNTFFWAIEYRFTETDADIAYNLTDGTIFQRDGATANLTGNIDYADTSWFTSPALGDLHLAPGTPAEDAAQVLLGVVDDIDGEARPIGDYPDVGADEYSPGSIINENNLVDNSNFFSYPNPFTLTLNIRVPKGHYALDILDVQGKRVVQFEGYDTDSGQIEWNARNEAAGIYFITGRDNRMLGKVLLLK